jgi:gamma-glutamylcyclotransferase (GGCT)/AIG2-like uncharacterized protein YtfP
MDSEDHNKLPLFVYGSLIDPIHRAEILGHAAEGIPATLHDYTRGRSRYWYVRRSAGAQTDGLVLTDLDVNDLATLDEYEDVPTLYTREQVEVARAGSLIRCWVYLPTAWAKADTTE